MSWNKPVANCALLEMPTNTHSSALLEALVMWARAGLLVP
jgi:hypothetical protein